MVKKIKLTVAPKKAPMSIKKVTTNELSKESEKANKNKLYKPKVRLTAHVKRK